MFWGTGADVDIIASSQKPSELLLLDLFIIDVCFSAPHAPSLAQLDGVGFDALQTLAAPRDIFWNKKCYCF